MAKSIAQSQLSTSFDSLSYFQSRIVHSAQVIYEKIVGQQGQLLPDELRKHALSILKFALEIENAWPVTRQLLLAISPQMEQSGYRGDWTSYLKKGISWSQSVQDPLTEAKLSLYVGILHQLQGQFKEADAWYILSRQSAEASQDYISQANALNRLGHIACLQNQDMQACEYIEAALNLLDRDHPIREFSYFVLGAVAINQHKWQDAVLHFQHSLAICEQQKDSYQIAKRLKDVGVAFHRQEKYQRASQYYQRAILLLNELYYPAELAVTLMNQGAVYSSLEEQEAALKYYQQAKPILRQVRDGLNLARLYNNQGYSYYKLQRWDEAEQAYLASIAQWKVLGNVTSQVNVIDGLGVLYLEQGCYEQAITTFHEALTKLDKIPKGAEYTHFHEMVSNHLYGALKCRVDSQR